MNQYTFIALASHIEIIPLKLFLIAFWMFVPALIYLDATRQKIGRIKGDKQSFAYAGLWGVLSLYLFIVTLATYLYMRKKLIAKAQEHPVTVNTIQRFIVALALLGIQFLRIQEAISKT